MKKFIIFFTLFILLICINSFSWATTDVLIVDTSVCGSSLGVLDLTDDIFDSFNLTAEQQIINYHYCLIYLTVSSSTEYLEIYLSEGPFIYDSSRNVITNEYGCIYLEYSEDNGQLTGTGTLYAEYYTTEFCYSYLSEDNIVVSNAIYSDTTHEDFYYNETTILNTTFFNNAFNYNDDVPNYDNNGGESGGESGGENGGEENDGGILDFLSDFWSNLSDFFIHLIIPTNEQWSDLQSSFEDNILDRFNLTSMSFNNDLTYDWRSNYIYE